jgi:hypothetical protein
MRTADMGECSGQLVTRRAAGPQRARTSGSSLRAADMGGSATTSAEARRPRVRTSGCSITCCRAVCHSSQRVSAPRARSCAQRCRAGRPGRRRTRALQASRSPPPRKSPPPSCRRSPAPASCTRPPTPGGRHNSGSRQGRAGVRWLQRGRGRKRGEQGVAEYRVTPQSAADADSRAQRGYCTNHYAW